MRLQVVSWDGDTSIVHEGATFEAWLPDEATGHFSQVAANVSFLKQEGATPRFLSQTPNEWYFPLIIQIVNRTEAGHSADRDTLAGLFPTSAERNQEKILLVKDIDDTNKNWQITGTPISFRYKKDFIRIIIAVAEPRWIETDEQSDSDTYSSGVGVTLDPEPKGNTEFDPILEISPSTQRGVGNSGEEIAHFVDIRSPSFTPGLSKFAIDLSDGGWNHATDVTNLVSLANADDIRVEINGQTVNRWISGANTPSAKLWVYIDLPKENVLRLGEVALSSGGSETEVQLTANWNQHSKITALPSSGQFKIGTERFTYTGKSINTSNMILKFTGVKRGVLQSSKAAHAVGDLIFWIPNQIWVYQGNTTVIDPPTTEDVADFEPAFELTSTNIQWIYDTVFFDADRKRGWGFTNAITELNPTQDNIIIGESEVFTDNEGTFINPAAVLGQKIASINDPYANGNFKNISASISATLEIPFGIKAVTVEGRKAYKGSEWVAKHSLWYSRGEGDWVQKWNDNTIPSVAETWENLDGAIEATLHTLDAVNGYRFILFLQKGAISGGSTQNWDAWQIDKCTLDFNSSEVPVITNKFAGVGGGIEVVELKYLIVNSATGDSIEVNASIELNETLILDFQNFDFYTLSDNIKFPISVRPTGDITGHWFRLVGGKANQITITDAGMPITIMNVRWKGRRL